MIKGNKFETAKSIFDDVSEELKSELEIDKLLVDIACEFINYRLTNKLSQKDLGKILGFSQSMIYKLESGDYNPTVKMLSEISCKLNWDFKVILDYNKGKEEPIYQFEKKETKNNCENDVIKSNRKLMVVA